MHADPDSGRLLVATTGPSQLVVLDSDARVQHAWMLPDAGAALGVRWQPVAV
jgi:hypothetical protein